MLDGLNRAEIASLAAWFAEREPQRRATSDIAQAARAATIGAVEMILIDIDEIIPGTVDEADERVTFAEGPATSGYGIVDEGSRNG